MNHWHKSEDEFVKRLEVLCKDLPESINNDYATSNWTYTKLCIKGFSDDHLLWLLGIDSKYVRQCIKDKESKDAILDALFRIIKFCLVWAYYVMDWEEYENTEH